ncbi:HAD-IA family hydrolase [Oceanicella actignis]|uniref:phosphoglycolate phosphatase n=1 Tax=Oceanicella actignis TaxID=1189325 RepID=A0A1M7SUP0_9RHOB|nr:HAD-IA family hydrolase [Oceanicella actignis]SES71794.1 phosphoglycolate phosphatase [Oceanicella actignis]SHN62263.1 phosphoglycolate phosphatase [Oceanicella actignis]
MSAPRLICDLDGTLIDSAASLCAAGNALLAELGRPPVTVETYKTFIGKGMDVQVERLLAHSGGAPEAGLEACRRRFRELYDPTAHSRAYPGAVAALRRLAAEGWRIGVCTQKPQAPAWRVLRALGFDMIESLAGGDSVPGALKPDPRMLAAAAAPLGDGPAVYVGDSETDAETARAGDMPFLLFLGGYRHGPAEAMHPAAVFAHHDALPALARAAAGLAPGAGAA